MEQNLIKGNFSKKEAKEIITNLYRSKISFHVVEELSSKERGLDSSKHSLKILQLNKSLKELINEIDESNSDYINLNCVVTLTVNV